MPASGSPPRCSRHGIAAVVLLDIEELADMLGERHRIIANNWQGASMMSLAARILERGRGPARPRRLQSRSRTCRHRRPALLRTPPLLRRRDDRPCRRPVQRVRRNRARQRTTLAGLSLRRRTGRRELHPDVVAPSTPRRKWRECIKAGRIAWERAPQLTRDTPVRILREYTLGGIPLEWSWIDTRPHIETSMQPSWPPTRDRRRADGARRAGAGRGRGMGDRGSGECAVRRARGAHRGTSERS